jgi:20S proteasome subunit beta 7
MITADTLASYGSLAQIRDMKRIAIAGDYTVIGASGDMSDVRPPNKVARNSAHA